MPRSVLGQSALAGDAQRSTEKIGQVISLRGRPLLRVRREDGLHLVANEAGDTDGISSVTDHGRDGPVPEAVEAEAMRLLVPLDLRGGDRAIESTSGVAVARVSLRGKPKHHRAWDVLKNKNVVTPDPEVAEAERERAAAVRELGRQTALPEASVTKRRYACSRHMWFGPERGPTPPESMCPFCRSEQETPKPLGTTVWVGGIPRPEVTVSPNAEALWEFELAQREARGEAIAGRHSETVALTRIDELRSEDREREEEKRERAEFYRTAPLDAVYRPKRKRRRTGQPVPGLGRVFQEKRADGRIIVHSDEIGRSS